MYIRLIALMALYFSFAFAHYARTHVRTDGQCLNQLSRLRPLLLFFFQSLAFKTL